MTGPPLILDADGLDALTEQPPPDRLRALLAEAWERQSDVLVPALVCAECCRGAGRTRGVEASLARHRGTRAGLRFGWCRQTSTSPAALGQSFTASARAQRTSSMRIRSP